MEHQKLLVHINDASTGQILPPTFPSTVPEDTEKLMAYTAYHELRVITSSRMLRNYPQDLRKKCEKAMKAELAEFVRALGICDKLGLDYKASVWVQQKPQPFVSATDVENKQCIQQDDDVFALTREDSQYDEAEVIELLTVKEDQFIVTDDHPDGTSNRTNVFEINDYNKYGSTMNLDEEIRRLIQNAKTFENIATSSTLALTHLIHSHADSEERMIQDHIALRSHGTKVASNTHNHLEQRRRSHARLQAITEEFILLEDDIDLTRDIQLRLLKEISAYSHAYYKSVTKDEVETPLAAWSRATTMAENKPSTRNIVLQLRMFLKDFPADEVKDLGRNQWWDYTKPIEEWEDERESTLTNANESENDTLYMIKDLHPQYHDNENNTSMETNTHHEPAIITRKMTRTRPSSHLTMAPRTLSGDMTLTNNVKTEFMHTQADFLIGKNAFNRRVNPGEKLAKELKIRCENLMVLRNRQDNLYHATLNRIEKLKKIIVKLKAQLQRDHSDIVDDTSNKRPRIESYAQGG
ncbi:hypothetical protein FA95DRAFT_1577263 [Auriscalpium vulgare]|uniref:Uncharacterized protein n=1 Tax=Auriscalpium vulgare TaxID=40419 RepID=A0ACB8R7R7_9AGAM|nr:hypothetical protein FA95DRAFT_1577263 [Auriscalpium vulgare]